MTYTVYNIHSLQYTLYLNILTVLEYIYYTYSSRIAHVIIYTTNVSIVPREGYCETYASPDPWPPCYRPPHYCRFDQDCDKEGYKCCSTNFCGGKTCKPARNGSLLEILGVDI